MRILCKAKRLRMLLLAAGLCLSLPAAASAALGDKVGVAHAAGNYHFSAAEPFLTEGAKAIQNLGSKVIKVFLQHPGEKYGFNSQWPADSEIPNIVDVLKTDYFRNLFALDFDVYVLQAHLDTVDSDYWKDGISSSEKKLIEDNYYNAAKYLLTSFKDTQKKFFLEHWESELYFETVMSKNTLGRAAAQEGFLAYFEARHDGIVRARKEIPDSGARVYSAAELIWISTHASDFRLIDRLNDVKADYISYSMGEECGGPARSTQTLVDNLNQLRSKLNGRPFYIGELQIPESDYKNFPRVHEKAVVSHINTSLLMGAEFAVLWQIYDNEVIVEGGKEIDRGFGLIRRDGVRTPLYTALENMLPLTSVPAESYVNKEYFLNLGLGETKWLGVNGKTARGAVISNLKNDYTPDSEAGWVIHTETPGAGTALKGKTMSLWIPDRMPPFLTENVVPVENVYDPATPDPTAPSYDFSQPEPEPETRPSSGCSSVSPGAWLAIAVIALPAVRMKFRAPDCRH